ncbi:hypothetical protein DACRYDRAFT_117091 [Dacryopinax primogenitus]|uniref:Alpha/beta hydrolase fold-3 domain-containing protein n=1 Tax=Dacryopinax primogenitus (strain DJM 731) TaxID=1858805 RepID=M5FSX0_DACPD|nr:uncharacterized protein DACRYDRAFT_117091 [Dacryopinax primogenitus]EJU00616.1 hypothetical protein DACRYDRAFT_117091 [Dacryopinax primogenitus]
MSYTSKHGPIHPSVLPLCDPAYVEYYNSAILGGIALDYTAPFDPSIRTVPLLSGGAKPLECVAEEVQIGECNVRVLTPPAEGGGKQVKQGGWPVVIYFHGGGWVLGSIDSEISIATQLCRRVPCVVVSVNYRLAPEHPYPAAVDDAWSVLLWVRAHAQEYNINPSLLAVGGASCGGQLAAVISHMAVLSSPPIPIALQLLTVPCTDLDPAAPYPSRELFALGPALPAARMNWFYNLFNAPPKEWKASPILAPAEHWDRLPPAFVVVGGLDFLRDEGVEYARLMNERGAKAELKVFEGVPHHFPSLDGVLEQGKEYVDDAVDRVAKAFKEAEAKL